MTIRDIIAPIEAFAPLSLQESYDNAGLVVGRLDDELKGGVLQMSRGGTSTGSLYSKATSPQVQAQPGGACCGRPRPLGQRK